MKPFRLLISCIVTASAFTVPASAQTATVSESTQQLRTYPFGDPSPMPRMGNIYPYFKFEGHTTTPVERGWKIVTLENQYIKVLIAPEIGGKILGAFEKSTGQAFLYFNKVVKFREIAMRGPWTSGGVEFNFGDIGHAPSTATPVDYLTRTNSDGSVSCFVGTIDLPSRTVWRVEIRLPKDKAYFETHSFWYNPTDLPTSRYHWMNAAADAASDLRFIYPGTAYIDHGGNAFDYPVDRTGRDLSWYRNNTFGSHKSYHVLGTPTDFFGAYYTERDFGVMHWSRYEEKPGKKIWMWSQARDGEIWVDLLTDPDLGNGQYVEIQSGLLFNQAGASSMFTPFKHQFLGPHSQERFSEAWFPVLKTGGAVTANLTGTLNLVRHGSSRTLSFCPLRFIDEALVVTSGGEEIFKKKLRLRPLETYRTEFEAPEGATVRVTIGAGSLVYQEGTEEPLARPTVGPEAFDWSSSAGLFTEGVERARQRDYRGALEVFDRCLAADPSHLHALVMAAECRYRRREDVQALDLAGRALAVDAYDGAANFVYGIINRRLTHYRDASDGFAKASRTAEFRSAAAVELAELALLERNWDDARYWAEQALGANRFDMRALRALAITARITRREQEAHAALSDIEQLDPLDHFARFERYLRSPADEAQIAFTSHIQTELPYETYLELAIDYARVGLTEEAALVLEFAPDQPIVSYWRAYLASQLGEGKKSKTDLDAALAGSPRLVFPHREETVEVLKWAESQKSHWKNKYYLGLLAWSCGRSDDALEYFASCGEEPDMAAFYASRALLEQPGPVGKAERDLRRALAVEPREWRTYRLLGSFYNEQGEYPLALGVLADAAVKFPSNDVILFDYAQTLLYNHKVDESLAILDTLTVLPFEGARYGRQTYREVCMLAALQHMGNKEYAQALALVSKAREWPEHLGVGRPYEVDERIEDYAEAQCRRHLGQKEEANRLLEKIVGRATRDPNQQSALSLLSALALRQTGRAPEAETVLRGWAQAHPEDLVAGWSLTAYESDSPTAEQFLETALGTQSPTSWYLFPHDPDYLLVRQIVRTLGTH